MISYETLFIVKPTLTEEEVASEIERVQEIVTQEGGELEIVDRMGMRRLAYPIDKQERGYYVVIYFKAPSRLIAELERQLRYNENIMRFMTVKYSSKKEIAQFEKAVSAIRRKSGESKGEENTEEVSVEESEANDSK